MATNRPPVAHEHQWGPWRQVNAAGEPPATRAEEPAGYRRYCACGAYQHRYVLPDGDGD